MEENAGRRTGPRVGRGNRSQQSESHGCLKHHVPSTIDSEDSDTARIARKKECLTTAPHIGEVLANQRDTPFSVDVGQAEPQIHERLTGLPSSELGILVVVKPIG